jgi:hypothetical protein
MGRVRFAGEERLHNSGGWRLRAHVGMGRRSHLVSAEAPDSVMSGVER